MRTIKVWPAPGRICRDLESGQPITAGQEVEESMFVIRRIKDGSLFTSPPPSAPPPAPATAASAPAVSIERELKKKSAQGGAKQ